MMNVLGICVVLTSLAIAGVWSPNPGKENPRRDDDDEVLVLLKEGHRTVVVEFEKEGDGNTKVLISPHHVSDQYSHHHHHKLSEADSSSSTSARELVCDALGNCKHKIASAIGKAKDKVCEVEEESKEAVGEALGKAKETVSRKAHENEEKVKEKVHDVEQGTKEAVQRVPHKAHEVEERAKEKAHQVAKEAAQKTKDGAKEADDFSKTIGKDIQTNVSKTADALKEAAASDQEGQQKKKKKKNLRNILRIGGHVVLMYLANWWDDYGAMMMGVVHLLGFSMAYGMSVWVTFFSSYVLAEALPRHQLGMVHSKIYPVYFRAMAYCLGAVLFSHLLIRKMQLFSNTADLLQAYNLLASLFMILANLFYLEPRATKVMFDRMKLEKEEGRGRDVDDYVIRSGSVVANHMGDPAPAPETSQRPEEERLKTRIVQLTQRLKKLNNFSSFLNVLTLMGLSWHLLYLGQRLHSAR